MVSEKLKNSLPEGPTSRRPQLLAAQARKTVQPMASLAQDWISPICAGFGKRLDFSAAFQSLSIKPWRENSMKNMRFAILGVVAAALLGSGFAQQASKHLLTSDELKKAVPAEYFFRGQKAPTQVRNAAGFQLADGKMTLAALVDASGYSTAIQQKYQGLLITEAKLNIGGATLAPGEYGFGFTADGKFVVMDVANNDVLSVPFQMDGALQRAIPLKMVETGGSYKLYAGKKWIEIEAQ